MSRSRTDLGNESRAIVAIGPVLEQTMPVDRQTSPHPRVGDVVDDVQVHLIILVGNNQRTRGCTSDRYAISRKTIVVDGLADNLECHIDIRCPHGVARQGYKEGQRGQERRVGQHCRRSPIRNVPRSELPERIQCSI